MLGELPIYTLWLISSCICHFMCVSHSRFQVCDRSLAAQDGEDPSWPKLSSSGLTIFSILALV